MPAAPTGRCRHAAPAALRLPGLVAGLWLLAAVPAVGQLEDSEAGRIIGQAIAAGVVLATDDFASAGSYEVDDEADSTFQVHQLGGRRRFAAQGQWQPFIGGRIGQVLIDQHLDLGLGQGAPLDFDVWGLAVEGGARRHLAGGWFGEVRGAATYSFARNRLRYPDAATAALLGPILDGVLFNWDAEALSLEASALLGWERRSPRGVSTHLAAELTRLRTDPAKTDHPVQDVTVTTHFERLAAGVGLPLGISFFGGELSLEARARHTFVGDDLAQPLDSGGFTDLRLALLAPVARGRLAPLRAIGVAVTHTTADAFEGWSMGVTFGH